MGPAAHHAVKVCAIHYIRSDDLSFKHLACRVPPFPFDEARASIP